MSFDALPKIDLHCHLDGSLNIDLALRMCRERGEETDRDRLEKLMKAPESCESLEEYLATFTVPLRFLQTRENLSRAAHSLALDAAEENTVYLETRFAPVSCIQEGISIKDTVEAVLEGLREAETELTARGHYFRSGVILCAMRHYTEEQNEEVFRTARDYLGSGVVGVDLAGAEAMFPNANFAELFNEARKLGLPFTIHSGETGSRENIRDAVEFGARRIGHGTAMKGDADLKHLLASRRVGVELCPNSNVQTNAMSSLRECPMLEFMEAGIPVSLNTDNRTVSATSLTKEWKSLDRIFQFDPDIFERIYEESVEMSFASDSVKENLLALRKDWKSDF